MCLAVPGRVLSVEGDDLQRTGRVDFGGVLRDISLAYLPEARPGDYVLVHVGLALSVVDEEAARETLELFAEMGGIPVPDGIDPHPPDATGAAGA